MPSGQYHCALDKFRAMCSVVTGSQFSSREEPSGQYFPAEQTVAHEGWPADPAK